MGPLPNGRFMAYKWGLLLTNLLTGVILQITPLSLHISLVRMLQGCFLEDVPFEGERNDEVTSHNPLIKGG